MRALIIEDDVETAGFLAKGLTECGFVVDVATTGREGLVQAVAADYDIAVVDRLLPEVDGIAIVEAMRRANLAGDRTDADKRSPAAAARALSARLGL